MFQQRDGPFLKSFLNIGHTMKVNSNTDKTQHQTYRQNSMIRVEESVGDNLPCSTPRKLLLVDEESHEFWYGKRWVRLQEPRKLIDVITVGKIRITSLSWIATSVNGTELVNDKTGIGGYICTIGELSHRLSAVPETADDVCKTGRGPEATPRRRLLCEPS